MPLKIFIAVTEIMLRQGRCTFANTVWSVDRKSPPYNVFCILILTTVSRKKWSSW